MEPNNLIKNGSKELHQNCALVTSRIDYCNSLLASLSEYDMKRLCSIQYSLCRIVNRVSRYSCENMSPHLKSLHWLPVKQRIDFKRYLLTYKIINSGLPPYFCPYFVPYSSKVFTRRSVKSKMFLSTEIVPFDCDIHKSKRNFDHSFFVSGPRDWNKLPDNVRCCSTLGTFRSRLKAYLFELAFPP